MNAIGNVVLTALTNARTWTGLQWLGLVAILVAYYLPRVLFIDAGTVDDIDTLYLVGMALIMGSPPVSKMTATVTTTAPNERGSVRLGFAFSLLALALVLAAVWPLGGCSTVERNGETLGFRLRDDPKRPPPACLYRLTIDGELLHEGAVDQCPAAPVCEEP